MSRLFSRQVWDRAWLLLTYTAAIWGANAVAARFAVGQISPMSLVFSRWLLVSIVMGWIVRRKIATEGELLVKHARRFVYFGFTGFTAFSALFYLAAYKTTAMNITVLQSALPPLVLLGSVMLYREKVTGRQVAGMFLAIGGILEISSGGALGRLTSLSFNQGDVLILVAFTVYAVYTLSLKRRPPISTLVFFFGVSLAALVTALPLFVAEWIRGETYWPSGTGFVVLGFVTLGPSLTGQLAYMRGIELIGPGRAGLFPALVPCFGALFAILLLHEPFRSYHAVALAMGVAGIVLAERSHRPPHSAPLAVTSSAKISN